MPLRTLFFPVILHCLCSVTLAAEPACDRFDDSLPKGAIARLGSLHLRHGGVIRTAAFTSDGKNLVTCEWLTISFWDRDTGKCVRLIPLKRNAPGQLRIFSRNAKVLMMDGQDNILHFLDVASGKETGTLNHAQCGPFWGKTLELSHDGKVLASVHRTSIALWDVADNKLLREFKEPSLSRRGPPLGLIALTPDGKQLVMPHADGSLHLVDVVSGEEVRAFEMPPPKNTRLPSPFERVTLSPDGRYLAFGGGTTPMTVCEVATGKRVSQLGQIQGSALAFSPNGRFLVVGESDGIHVFGVLSGKEIRKLPQKRGVPDSELLFSPDGRTLATFPNPSLIRLVDVVAQRRLHPPIGHETSVKTLAFFPDGKRLVSADQAGEMRVWDIAKSQTLAQRKHNYGSESLTVDRDGETVRFAGHDGLVREWNQRTGREEIHPKLVDSMYTTSLALSPDGRSLAILVPKGDAQPRRPAGSELQLFDLKTNKAIASPSLSKTSFRHLTFTPDSRRLAVGCVDFALRLWDRDTGKMVRELKDVRLDGPPIHLAFAPDGRSFAGLIRNRVCIRETVSGANRLQIPPPNGFFSLAYSPDFRFLALGEYEGRIFIYSTASGKQLAQCQGKQGYVFAVAFSRDSRLLASAGANGTILIWKVPEDDSVAVVHKAEEAVALWQALGESDAAAANRALAGLAAAPALALPIFKQQLPYTGKALGGLQLLRRILDSLRPALDKILSTDIKERMEDLSSHLEEHAGSQRLRFLRALEVLERIGTPEAKDVLHHLSGKQIPADLAEEVQAGLRRMGERP